eukprot:gnl/TRDRNA2_/TRDRNA2_69382_c0_seq1.p1 gnl/TRDRNA2_/TRDRNA2_69382_c0~~gnl/TRDRNA2_/TRDRNA2_69382_c0_seq1.p1  ORF type:complete len:247 (-),score=56.42 gnl/TRDRNA2_/TRDRNA2_69382_c0_seq1:56-796(-)
MSTSSASVSKKMSRSWASVVKGQKEKATVRTNSAMSAAATEFFPAGLNPVAEEFVPIVTPKYRATDWTCAALNEAFLDSDSDDSDASDASDDDGDTKLATAAAKMNPDATVFVPAGLSPAAKKFISSRTPHESPGPWTCEALDAALESDSDSDDDFVDEDTSSESSCEIVGRPSANLPSKTNAPVSDKLQCPPSPTCSSTTASDSSDSDSGFEKSRRSFDTRLAAKLSLVKPPPGLEHLGPQQLVA